MRLPLHVVVAGKRGIDMIEICTMPTAFNHRRDGSQISYPESIRRCKAAGFDVLDLNMCSLDRNEGNELAGDDWEVRVERIIEERDRQGVTFYQTHPPYRKGSIETFPDPEREKYYWDMIYRSLDVTARIGAKWAIMHAINDADDPENYKVQLEKNHRHFDPVVEYASKLGIGIAFENTVQFPVAPYRFAAVSEELIALCDSYHSPNVGICWDFGHGNLMYPGFSESALRPLGKRLNVTHVHDNLGVRDDHFLPFVGNIRWEKLMPVLKEIEYEGTLNLEISLSHRMPDMLRDEAARLAYNTTKILLNMAEG
jgi:sugar phosphate isomerase/epimerase